MAGKLKVQNFRTNDLSRDSGKQVEFGRAWCEDFFGIGRSAHTYAVTLLFKPLSIDQIELADKTLELKFGEVTNRGDRKAYANDSSGYSQIKNFFINELHLTEANLGDYFAIYKTNLNEYFLYYVPKMLYDNFINLFRDIDVSGPVAHKTVSSLTPLPDQPLQQIFYGAPGTGKSHTIKKTTDSVDSKYVVRTTFHPDSDYSTFVGAYKPKMEVMPRYNPQTGEQMGVEKRIVYAYTPQAFLKAYITAWQNPEQPVYLIIEEINRGNCAQIFGDLFQLLDRGDDGQSCYPIKADQDMQMHLMEVFAGYDALPENIRSGEELVLPSNLYIWATMNTSDQSLFPIDSAFKRRWEWKYIPITQGKDRETGQPLQWRIVAEKSEYDWWSFLQKINEQIASTTSSEDKKLGFFFTKAKEGVISAEKFVSKVIFYLWNDVFKDYGFDNKIFQILDEENATLTFDKFYAIDNMGNTIVRKDLVERFLEGLGVEKAGTIDNGQLTMDNEDDEKVSDLDNSTLKFSIIFADGTEVLEKTQFGSYAKALKRIGLEKVEPIATQLKYSRLGCPLVSKEEYEEILDNTQGYSYVNVDGYNIIKGINLRTMRNFLTQVSEELGLGLNLEIK